jgi:hypothetical protein
MQSHPVMDINNVLLQFATNTIRHFQYAHKPDQIHPNIWCAIRVSTKDLLVNAVPDRILNLGSSPSGLKNITG